MKNFVETSQHIYALEENAKDLRVHLVNLAAELSEIKDAGIAKGTRRASLTPIRDGINDRLAVRHTTLGGQ